MKVVMIFDQIQSGLGTKDDKMLPLGGKPEAIGPAIMMAPFLKSNDIKISACLYCGNGTYLENPEEISRKMCAMVKKLKPDYVICGPAFNFVDYAGMCAKICLDINSNTDIPAVAAMSKENEATISNYKDKIDIIETPKKGGFGLNDSLENICKYVKLKFDGEDVSTLKDKICFK